MPSIVAIDTRFVLDLRLYIATAHQTHDALHGLKSADDTDIALVRNVSIFSEEKKTFTVYIGWLQ